MPVSSIRKLVAILFADIAGYTSLMQQNEADASKKLEKFRQVLNEQVPLSKGQIMNFYGDGCMAIFESPVEACQAATAMQQQFADDPTVPVRIGLHSGTVNVEKEHVYGNAINITSRIESLGIPGSILLSKRMRDELLNQPDFLMVSLGKFAFKNVEEPMEVFALANKGLVVPKRGRVKGKLQPRINRKQAFFLSAMALLLLVAGWFLQTQWKNDALLSQEVRESRIAILPFENKTNDPELDVLGDMAADWIVQALMNMDEYKVVSTVTVREHLPILATSPASFLQRTGAEKIIRGSIYADGEDLVVQTQIIDTESGEIEFAFPEVNGPADNPPNLIKELRERLLSYLIEKEDPDLNYYGARTFENPPKYEAYKAYLEANAAFGVDYDKAIAASNKAISIDPDYFWPYLEIFSSFINLGRRAEADSMLQLIDRRFEQLMPYEQMFYDWAKAVLASDLEAVYQTTKKFFLKDPRQPVSNYLMGLAASNLNRPREVVEYYQYLDYTTLPIDNQRHTWGHNYYALNLIRLDRLDEAMDILKLVPIEKASHSIFYRKLDIFVQRNQPDSIRQMIADLEDRNFPPALIHDLHIATAKDYALLNDRKNQLYWAGLALEKIQGQPESAPPDQGSLAASYYFSEQYDQALPIYAELVNTSGPSPFLLMRLAVCYARTGTPAEALAIIEQLKEMEEPQSKSTYTYHIGLVYAVLGEKEKAMQYLKQSHREGYPFHSGAFQNAFELIPLHGYPPYEAFVAPK